MRKLLFEDRKKLTELSKEVANVFKYWYKNKYKKRELEVGVITVIHTFGRDLKFNPHVHALVTEGAIDKHHEWVKVEYIPDSFLRRAWQKLLMNLLKKWYPNDPKVKRFIDTMYRKYPHGFYVNAEQRMKDAKGEAKYIGRYLARPAIAEYLIVSYDGEKVHFWYEDHRTDKRVDEIIPVYRFIYCDGCRRGDRTLFWTARPLWLGNAQLDVHFGGSAFRCLGFHQLSRHDD